MDELTYMRLPGYRGGTIEYYQEDAVRDEDDVINYLEGVFTSREGNSFWGRLSLEDGKPEELELLDVNGNTIDYIYF